MSNKDLTVAVIGLGKMGLVHASILNTFPNVKLVALCDKNTLIRRLCNKLFDNVQTVDDLEKLADQNLDIAYVTTPIPSHFPVIKIIYSKNVARNVFVEKTLAKNHEQSKDLCGFACNSKSVNMVGYMKRFGVTFKKAKEMLDHETLGSLTSFEAYAFSSDFAGIEKGSRTASSRGGVLSDLGAHVMDLALWFFGDLEVDSAKLEFSSDGGCEDSASFHVKKSNGLEGQFNVSWRVENYRLPEFGLEIKGSNGIIRVNDDVVELLQGDKKAVLYRHNLNDNVGFLLGAPEYYLEDESFINSLVHGNGAEPSFATASKVDYLIDQVKKKAE